MSISNKVFARNLAVAALATVGLGVMGQVHAAAYSYAHVEVRDLNLLFDPALTTPTLTRTRDTYTAAGYAGYMSISHTNPKLGLLTSDAQQSFSGNGTAPAENTWAPALTGSNYGARADAYTAADLSQIVSLAESNVANNADLETGAESANNTGVISFSLGAGQTARLAMNMKAFWDLAASVTRPDDYATASGSAFFILSETGGSSQEVFRYDVFQQSCASGAGDPAPCSRQSGDFLSFDSGWSPLIDAGSYLINLRLEATGTETAMPAPPAHVPEPATLSLLGAGLVGLLKLRSRQTLAKGRG